MAPTAPHATPPEAPTKGTKKSGPARFWSTRRIRIALAIALTFSFAIHWYVAPWRLFPDRSGLELKDNADELTIPVELLGEEPPPEEKPTPPLQTTPSPEDDPNAPKNKPDAGPKPKPKPDASAPDAEAKAEVDASIAPIAIDGGAATSPSDGGAPTDAGEADAANDAGLLASGGDAGPPVPGANGPRDPGAMIGMPGLISAGTVNVTLMVNIAVIRTNPVGARMGPLLYGIPQWNEFMKGSQLTIDPIKDTDWILIYGPSLIHTDRDAVFVHYSISDTIVEAAVDSIAKRYDKGGAYDAGVPGVKAAVGFADNGERVFLRGQSHVLVIVPKDKANDFAKLAKRATINPRVRPGEAMRLVVKDPWKQITIPGLKFNQSLKELRLWIVPRPSDGGADVFVEGDCTDEEAANEAADALTDIVKRVNSLGVRVVTRGLLNNAKITADGTHIKSQLSASQEQLEALLQGLGAALGAQIQPPGGH